MINLVLGVDLKLTKKNMCEYGLLNLVYVNSKCKELEELPGKTKDVVNDLKRISKTKEIIFIRFFTICPKNYDNKWYPA